MMVMLCVEMTAFYYPSSEVFHHTQMVADACGASLHMKITASGVSEAAHLPRDTADVCKSHMTISEFSSSQERSYFCQ